MDTQDQGISFEVSAEEASIIRQIVGRAVEMGLEGKKHRLDLEMDLRATHANGCPLRLADLLAADAFNFVHDIGGIRRRMNRKTGKLGGFFVPRYACPE